MGIVQWLWGLKRIFLALHPSEGWVFDIYYVTVVEKLFSLTCVTCHARIAVYSTEAIGKIFECPKCQSMVNVQAPPGWQPPKTSENLPDGSSPGQASASAMDNSSMGEASTGSEGTFFGLAHSWFWLIAAMAAAAVLCVVAGLAIYFSGNPDNAGPASIQRHDNTLAQQADSPAEDTSKDVDSQESKQNIASSEPEPTTTAESKSDVESAVETAAEKIAEPTSPPKAQTPESNTPAAKPPAASPSLDVNKEAAQKVLTQSKQPMPTIAGTSKVVKLICPKK